MKNKKNIKTIFIITGIILVIIICIVFMKYYNSDDAPVKLNMDIKEKKVTSYLIKLSIKKGTLTNKGLTLVINNDTKRKYHYCSHYNIEYKKNGRWYEVVANIDDSNESICPIIQSGEIQEQVIDWEKLYGILPKGYYRIGKTFGTDIYGTKNIYTVAYFEIK